MMATAAPLIHIVKTDDLRIGDAVLAVDGKGLIAKHVWFMDSRLSGSENGFNKHSIISTTDFPTFRDRLFNPEDFTLEPVPIHSDEIEDPEVVHATDMEDAALLSHKISKAHRALKLIGQDDLDDVRSNTNHLALRTCFQFLHPGKIVEIEHRYGPRTDSILAIGVGIRGPLAVRMAEFPDNWIDLTETRLTFEDKISPKRTTVTVDRLQSVVPN